MVELAVVIVILGLLAGLAIPSFVGAVDKPKKTVCESNRQILIRAYVINRLSDNSCILTKFINNECTSSTMDVKKGKCPSGGTYTAQQVEGTNDYEIICSVHGAIRDDEDGDDDPHPGGLIPGTSVSVNSTWPKDEEFTDSSGYPQVVSLHKGQTLIYDGEYYIVSLDLVDLYHATEIPTPTNGWWKDNGVIKIKDRIITWNGGSTEEFNNEYKNNLPQIGEICSVNGRYYVFTLKDQSWIDPPNVITANWVELVSG